MYFLPGLSFFLSCVLSSGRIEAAIPHTQLLYPQRSLGEAIECDDDKQCQYFVEESECIDGSCKCADDHLLSSDGSRCLKKVKELGSSCEDHVQCSQRLSTGGVCEDGTCKCKRGYHYLKGLCWKNSNLHEGCVRNEQCFSTYEYIGLKCDSGVCKCRENYYERLNSGCRRERKTGESCNLDKDCVDGTTCENTKCTEEEQREEQKNQSLSESFSNAEAFRTTTTLLNCSNGQFELNGECVLELGMKCNDDSECYHIKNAFCLDNTTCGCEPATFVASEDNRECLRVARGKTADIASTACKKDPQCGVFGESGFCQSKRCACRNGSYWERESGVCWPVRQLGDSCVSRVDCHPSETKADCMGNICRCPAKHHPKKNVCVPDAVAVGDSCENDEECRLLQNSFCNSSQVCACKQLYYPESGKCVPGVESDCNSQEDCSHLKNTECRMDNSMQQQCLCLENHCSSEDRRYCLPVINFEEKCLETFQCLPQLGDFGECRDGVCQCRTRTHFSHGKCYRSKFIGERCSRLPECYPGNDTDSLICLNGYCSCNYDYEPDENGICVRTNSGSNLGYHSLSLLPAAIFIALRK